MKRDTMTAADVLAAQGKLTIPRGVRITRHEPKLIDVLPPGVECKPSRKRRNAGGETALVRSILEYLRLRGIMAWRVQSQGTFDPVKKVRRTFNGLPGVSDIIGLLPQSSDRPGVLLALEVKTATGKLSESQRSFLDRVNRAGGIGCVVRSIEDVSIVLSNELGQ